MQNRRIEQLAINMPDPFVLGGDKSPPEESDTGLLPSPHSGHMHAQPAWKCMWGVRRELSAKPVFSQLCQLMQCDCDYLATLKLLQPNHRQKSIQHGLPVTRVGA